MIYQVMYGVVYLDNFSKVMLVKPETLSYAKGNCISFAEGLEKDGTFCKRYTRIRVSSFDIKERGC